MRVPLLTFLTIACLVLGGVAVLPGATAAPAVTSVSPSSGTENGNTNLNITGTGFSAGALVCLQTGSWTGTCADANKAQQIIVGSCSGTSTCKITARTPPRTGVSSDTPVNVIVRNLDGQTTVVTNGFTYNHVNAPTLTGVTPNSGTSNGGDLLTLKGTNFESNKARPAVCFGTVASATATDPCGTAADAPVVTVVDTTTLKVVTPAKIGGGASDITVIYASGADTLEDNFVYTPAATPTVTSLSPTSGGTNGGNRVTITGTGFAPGATVCFASLVSDACPANRAGNQTIFTSTTSLSTIVPARSGAGAVDVTVVNPDGKSKTLLTGYSYVLSAAPTVSGIFPTFGPSKGGTVIAVDGENFAPGTVLCTDNPATACGTRIQPTETPSAARAFFPVPPGTAGTSETFYVRNPDGQSAVTPSFSYTAAILVKEIDPKVGPANGGDTVDIVGENFDCGGSGTPVVEFDGKPAVHVATGTCTAGKTTTLEVVTPGHATGTTDVRVKNPSGLLALVHNGYTFEAATGPAITNVTTPSGTINHTNGVAYSVTVNGTSFGCPTSLVTGPDGAGPLTGPSGPLPTITVGTTVVPAGNVTKCTATQIIFKAPSRASGSAPIKVRNPSGQESATKPFVYVSSIPTISSVTPSSGPANGGTTITISGDGFSCGAGGAPTVLFGTTPAFNVTTGSCSAGSKGWTTSTLTVITPGRAAGAVQVKVTNPSTEATQNNDNDGFTYAALPAAPTVSTVSPNSGDSLGNESRTVNGSNFACPASLTAGPDGAGPLTGPSGPVPTVSFGGSIVNATDITTCTATAITLRAPPHAVGSVNVVVTNPSGQASTGGTGVYTYAASTDQPVINSLSTTRGTTLGGTLLVISGPATFYCDSSPATVSVSVPAGSGGSPITVTRRVSESLVVIGTTVVPAGNVDPGACTAGRTDKLTVTMPERTAGVASVIVINPDGRQGSQSGGFRYLALPTITSVTPSSGSDLGGPLVTLKGANHLIGATALFTQDGTTTASAIVAVPKEGAASETLAKTPPGDSGSADVTYVGPYGESATLASGYTYTQTAGPTATALSLAGRPNVPPEGPVSGQTSVEISGANIGSGAIVCFGPLSDDDECPAELRNVGTATVNGDGTLLTAVTPSHSLGTVDVTVINPDGQPSSPILQAFSFLGLDQFPLPTITTVTPASGPTAGGTVVTINGTNLASDAKVKFGTANATSVQFVGPTSIKATTPPHAAGAVDVVVTVGAQSSLPKVGAFTYLSNVTTDPDPDTDTDTDSDSDSDSDTGTTALTPATIENANLRIEVTVTREGDTNIIEWDLPTPPAGHPVMGIQIWRSNSPYALIQDIPATDSDFGDTGEFRDSSDDALATSKYLVTMYYGLTEALGQFADGHDFDEDDYEGVASVDGDGTDDGSALPTWAIVLIALGILFLVVLVAVLIARGRNRDGQQAATQGYAWQEEGEEAKAAEGEWQPPAEVHQARCPACATSFTATGQKPIVTVCPGCGKKGILR